MSNDSKTVNDSYQRRIEELNEKCRQCREKYGTQNYDHCDYHCQTGFEIHKLYCMKGEALHRKW